MKVKLTWDFEDTEYEEIGQRIAVETLGLPVIVETEDICDDDDIHVCIEEVKSYMYDNYSFEIKKVKILEE